MPVTLGLPIYIYTSANPNDVPGALDTALSLFDATGTTLLASDDDDYPRIGTDGALPYRPTASGFVCVRVEDFSSWATPTPVLPSPNQFTLGVTTVGPTGLGTLDQEPNDVGAGQSAPLLNDVTLVAGGLDSSTDVDVYSVVAPAGTMRLNVSIPPLGDALGPGVTSYGSSLVRFSASVQTTGSVVLGQLAPPATARLMPTELAVPLGPGTYRVVISRPPGSTPGPNDFYASTISATNDYPVELEVGAAAANDSKTNAEVLTFTTSPTNPKVRSTSWMGHLPPGDASDYFKFTSVIGATAVLKCTSARSGSGLTGFTAALLANTTTPVKSEVEVATADLEWSASPNATSGPVALTINGSYYFRLTTSSRSASNTGDYYRCDASVIAP